MTPPPESSSLRDDRGKAGQREGDLVRAGREIGNPVLPGVVGDASANLVMSAGLDASIVTPGRTAPEVSRTVPGEGLRGDQRGDRANETNQ
jgi:hypothetical protein